MPKRKNKSKHRADDKKSKYDDEEKSNSEVLIKPKSPSESSSSESESSSSDDSYYQKKRVSKRKKRKESANKGLRRLQDQIDLFQRNVDIKLNYLECLLQTVIRNQEAGTSVVSPPAKDNLPSPAVAQSASNSTPKTKSMKGSGILPFLSPGSALLSSSTFKDSKKNISKNSRPSFELPDFPLKGKLMFFSRYRLKICFFYRLRLRLRI